MNCKKCQIPAVKNGRVKSNNVQRYFCKKCRTSFVEDYRYNAKRDYINNGIVVLLKEGCGTRSISRILGISTTTVTKRIVQIAASVCKPPIPLGKTFEMDEIRTFVGTKKHPIYVAYAIDRETRFPVDFTIGNRTNKTLKQVINTLLLSHPKQIRTDKLLNYRSLIPKDIHNVKYKGTNRIERMNLTLRTHLKRLSRRTICYSKSLLVLSSIVKIYFWY